MTSRTKKKGPGFVYVMMNEAAPGRIKIGLSVNVESRTAQMSHATASPGDVETLVAVEVSSMLWLESRLHDTFEHARVSTVRGKREWFEIGPDPVLKEIRRIAATPEGKVLIRSIDIRYTPGAGVNIIPHQTERSGPDPVEPVVAALLAVGIPLDRIRARSGGYAIILGAIPSGGAAPCHLLTPVAYLCPATLAPQLGPALRALALYHEIRHGRDIASTTRSALELLHAGRKASELLLPLRGTEPTSGQFVIVDPDLMACPDFSYAIRMPAA